MILTVFFADYMKEDSFGIGIIDEAENMRENSLFDVKNLFIILPICAYANNMHHSITTLTTPLEDKSQAAQVFTYSFIISFVAYVLLGLTVAMYFGTDNQPSSNLNWNTYVGVFGDSEETPFYAKMIKFYTILFPSIDVASTYPLYAVTLGNNLYSFSKRVQEEDTEERELTTTNSNNNNDDRFTSSLFRLAAALPPIIGGYFVSDLGHITAYTGLTGLAIGITFPSLLSYCSKRKMDEMQLSGQTDYTFECSHFVSLALMIMSAVMLGYILYSFVCIEVPDGVRR
jgi:amino acid permease